VNRVERRLRMATAPRELEAEARAWPVALGVYRQRSRAPHKPSRRLWLVPVAVTLVGVLALTPAGAAVHRWIDRTLGVKNARPALFSLPSPGRILVAGGGGAWTIADDGSRRRLGPWSDATWSPHGLYVAVTRGDQLAAVNPRGMTQWSVARPEIHDPRWYGPSGYRLAYLSASTLRVIAGDGTGDRQLTGDVAQVAPAWRPGHAYDLAYVRGNGEVVVREADTGALRWGRRVEFRPRMLGWSADGRRLMVLTNRAAFVYDGSGKRIARLASPGGGLGDDAAWAALSPDGRRVALLSGGELTVTELGGPTRRVFAGAGLRQLAWSPDGQWLVVGWPAANQWVFLHAVGHPRIIAASRIAQQFGTFPAIEGWCCTDEGAAG
jgi:hypothetical protein